MFYFNTEHADPMRSQALGLSAMLKQNAKYKDFGFCPSCNHNEPIGKYFFSKIYKTTVFPHIVSAETILFWIWKLEIVENSNSCSKFQFFT